MASADPQALNQPRADVPARLPGINSLRALAAISVLIYHVTELGGFSGGSARATSSVLSGGVPLFFAISGFLLYRPWVLARAHADRVDVRQYMYRRALRILPGYWVCLTLLTAVFGLPGVFTRDWWRYYGLLQIYDLRTYDLGMGVAWTLCVELSFYVSLPVYAAVADRLRATHEAWLLGALAGTSMLLAAILVVGGADERAVRTLPGTFVWFAAGMFLALLTTMPDARLMRTPPRTIAGIAVLAGTVVYASAFIPSQQTAYLTRHLFVAVLSFCLLRLALAKVAGRTRSFSVASWLGVISYSIYLYHATLIPPLRDRLPSGIGAEVLAYIVLLFATVTVVLPVAALSYYLVERPFESLRTGGRVNRRP